MHSVQRQWRGCNNISSFLQRTALIARYFCEGCTWHDLHILVTVPFCCDRKARAACAQSFALWQLATIEIMRCDHFLLLVRATYIWVLFWAYISVRGEPRIQCNASRKVATVATSLLLGLITRKKKQKYWPDLFEIWLIHSFEVLIILVICGKVKKIPEERLDEEIR